MKKILGVFLYSFVLIAHVADLHSQQTATPAAGPSKRFSDQVSTDLPRWFRFNGEYRMRLEGFDGDGFRPDNTDKYVLSRLRVNTTFIPTSWLKLQFQGQDAQIGGRNPVKPNAAPYENTFDVRQAYVEAGNVETSTLGFRVGRQELAFGEMRLLGHLNWTNTARSFDAVRASYKGSNYHINAFAASVVNPLDGKFDRHTDANNIHGVYGSFTELVPKATVEPYVLWRLSRGIKSESGNLAKLDFKTIGFRWVGKLPSNFDYGTEIAGQTGSLGTDDVKAWAEHVVLGYTLANVKFTPRFFAEYNFASGDASSTDGKRGTFDQLYPTGHDKLGLADQIGWKNIHGLRSGVELKPNKNLTMSGSYHSWWLANTHDGLYNAAGALVVKVTNGSAGRFVGQEADVQTVYLLNDVVQIAAGYAHVFPGAFLKTATPGKSYKFPYVMVTYLF